MTNSEMAQSASRQLGRFIAELSLDEVPHDIRELARLRVLDTVGAALAGRNSDLGRRTLQRVRDLKGVEGPCQYWMTTATGGPLDVAFTNSMLVHAVLMEDVGLGGHPGANVVPVALAVAQETGASGQEILEAVVAGYEIQTRIAAGYGIYRAVGDRGLRGTTVTGAFGAAATAAKLYRLPAAKCASAIAFAASLCAAGVEQPILEGSDERLIQMAQNTRSGLAAAQLARDGYTGAEFALDGEAGFYRAYTGAPMPAQVLEGLGSMWRSTTDNLYFKSHPTAGMNVGPIYVIEKMLEEGTVSAADVDRIESFTVLMKWWRVNTAYISKGPFTTFESAILSGPLAVATTLLYGEYTVETLAKAMTDPAAIALAQKADMHGVATWEILGGDVTIRFTDGSSVHRSSADMPEIVFAPDWAQAAEKFRKSVGDAVDEATREAFIAEIAGLAAGTSLQSTTKLLGVPVADR